MSRLFHRHRRLLIGGAAAVVLLVGAAAVAGLVSRGGGSNGGSSSSGDAIEALLATIGAGASVGAAKEDLGSSSAGTAHTAPASSSDVASDLGQLEAGRSLVRTGEMTVIVGKGGVPRAAARVIALTAGYGGYVLTSQVSSSQGASQAYAEITVRVPAVVYDAAIQVSTRWVACRACRRAPPTSPLEPSI